MSLYTITAAAATCYYLLLPATTCYYCCCCCCYCLLLLLSATARSSACASRLRSIAPRYSLRKNRPWKRESDASCQLCIGKHNDDDDDDDDDNDDDDGVADDYDDDGDDDDESNAPRVSSKACACWNSHNADAAWCRFAENNM